MGGIFGGVKDLFTGGGGAPQFQGLKSGPRDAMINAQVWAMEDARRWMQEDRERQNLQYQQQQALMPLVYQKLGVSPQFNEAGQIIGWGQATETPEQRAAREQQGAFEGQLSTAQALQRASEQQFGYQPIFDGRGQVVGYQNTGDATSRAFDQALASGQTGYQQLARQAGYFVDPSGNVTADPNSQRNQFLAAQDQLRASLQGQQGQFNTEISGLLGQNQAYQNDFNAWMGSLLGQTQNYMGEFKRLQDQQLAEGQQAKAVAGWDLMNAAGPAETARAALMHQLGMEGQLQGSTLERLGIKWDPTTGYSNNAASPEMIGRALQAEFLNRAQAAARGEAQVNPGLERQLAEEEQILRSNLQASLGPDYATSTPGMAALADFAKRRAEVLYNQQQNDMNLGVQNANALQGTNLATLDRLARAGDPAAQAALNLGNFAFARTGALDQYTNMLQPTLMNTAQGLQGYENLASNMVGQRAEGNLGFGNAAAGLVGQRMQGNLGYSGAIDQSLMNRTQGDIAYQDAALRTILGGAGTVADLAAARRSNQINTLGALYGAGQEVRNAAQALDPYASQGTSAATLAQLFGSLGSVYNLAGNNAIPAAAGLATANTALPWQQAKWEGGVQNYQTNQNNIFWQNLAKSAGSSLGKGAGGGFFG